MAYDDIINAAGQQYGIDPDLLRAQMMQESKGNPNAVSNKGAMGLMQLMPGTAKDLGVTNITDPQQNIMGGAKYMRQLIDKYGDLDKAVQAYNMGPGAFDEYQAGKRKLPTETAGYVDKVSSNFANLKKGVMPQQTTAADEWLGQTTPTHGGVSNVDAWLGANETPQAAPAQVAAQAPAQPAQRSPYDELTRQIGLTARAGVTGLSGIPNMLGDAANSLINYGIRGVNAIHEKVTPPSMSELVTGRQPWIPELQMPSEVTQRALNAVGVPQPENATERVVQDVAGAMAGAGGQARLGQELATRGTGVLSRVGNVLATAPGMQITGAAGGAAGQGVAREEGAGPLGQAGAAFAGALGPMLVSSGITSAARAMSTPAKAPVKPQNIQTVADRATKEISTETGTKVNATDNAAVAAALVRDPTIDPKALVRSNDFRELGIDPTLGQVTRDPSQYARERNIRGVQGVGDPVLARLSNQNNQLQEKLNALRGNPMEPQLAGEILDTSLKQLDEKLSRQVTEAYKTARQSAGKDLDVPLGEVAQKYAEVLKNFGEKVPGGVRNNFEELGLLSGTQKKTFTIEDADKLLKVINSNVGSDKATNTALGQLRSAIKDAVLSADAAGGPYAPAVALAKQRFDLHDAIPALKAAAEGSVDPDDFVRRFIINGKTGDVRALADLMNKEAPGAFFEARNQIGNELNRAAFGTNTTGDKLFTPDRFNEVLRKIGSQKLSAFFDPQEVDQINRIGRVGAYINSFPSAAPVNTSNTAAIARNLMSRVPEAVEHIPLPGTKVLGGALRAATRGAEERAFVQQSLNPNLAGTGTKMTKAEAELASKLLLQPTVRVPVAKP